MKKSRTRFLGKLLLAIVLATLLAPVPQSSAVALTLGCLVTVGGPNVSVIQGPSPVSGQTTVAGSYGNTCNVSFNAYMWVSVMNNLGQTVGVYIGSAAVLAGQNLTINAVVFNVPSGTYSAAVFVTTMSGVVVSTTTSTVPFTVP